MATFFGNNFANYLAGLTTQANTIYGYGGNDTIVGQGFNDTLVAGSGNDVVYGGGGNDKMWGEAGDDDLYGGSGADTVSGGSGFDYVDGGTGNDKLFGGADDDIVKGSAGNDVVDGGTGDDDLWGGTGYDTFQFADFGGFDIIHDFTLDVDRITLNVSSVWSINDVWDSLYQAGADAVLDFGGGDLLVLTNTNANALVASDFLIV